MTSPSLPLLEVRNLCTSFPVYSQGLRRRKIGEVKAVNHVSFDLARNETLGLVGESGCGKTTVARSILRAIPPTSGSVVLRLPDLEWDLATLPASQLKALRPRIQMIFQDPYSSLNPRMTVGAIVREPLDIHRMGTPEEREARVSDMLEHVGLNPEHKQRYPHAFSGGQRQRIGIARALVMSPDLVVADEAVSALDVSVQAQVINLLSEIKQQMNLSMIFVAHDLSVVRHICDRVAVMYLGSLVEVAPCDELFNNPLHPYTRMLLKAVPHPDPDVRMEFTEGQVADAASPPAGCTFHPRCPHCLPACREETPELREISPGHFAACPVEL
jgi:oligopeptide/dipeptide ABC transporter ATP-binding protein